MFRSELLILVSYIVFCSICVCRGGFMNLNQWTWRTADTDNNDERIAGGTEADINNFRYQVAVLTDEYICGGSLIHKNWVLTAAHCVYNKVAKDFTIVAGSATANTGGLRLKVKKIIMHELYNQTTMSNDIALVQLQKAFTNQQMKNYPIKPIALAKSLPDDGASCTVSGYGTTSFQGPLAPSLRKVTVKKINKAKCNSNYGGVLTASMFCAGLPNGGKDSCQGDSGGPLIKDGKQIGVVSWGDGCAEAKYPGIYTSVPYMLNWINSKI